MLFFLLLGFIIKVSLCERAYFLEEDNDQTLVTEIDRTNSDLDGQILDLLGLEDPSSSPVTRKKRNDKVSSFMEKLYKELESEDNDRTEREGHTTSRSSWRHSDRIMSLTPEEISIYDGNMLKLSFFAESLFPDSKKATLTQSELHLFFEKNTENVKVALFYEHEGELIEVSNPKMSSNVNEVNFNITEVIQKWIANTVLPSFYVQPSSGDLLDSFIIAGFEDDLKPARNRVRRSIESVPSKRSASNKYTSSEGKQEDPEGCRRHGLYVNFEDLGWKSWVIAPEGYSAYYCGGGCSFPLHNKVNATNHAIVQNLAHNVHPSRAEDTKCAPTVLAPLKILYTDNHKNVVMKRFRDMVVQECGCH